MQLLPLFAPAVALLLLLLACGASPAEPREVPCPSGEACPAGSVGGGGASAEDDVASLLATGRRSRTLEEGRPGSWPRPVKYGTRPRVRREWRTLSEATRLKVARAFWTLKNVSTAEGRSVFGEHFWNYDELLIMHACALYDPRCDQGHFGPHFMTFHRAFLLRIELALLSVEPSIGAMPYWNIALDAEGGKYFKDPKDFIFSDGYFGAHYGQGENYAVINGLFADWPVVDWTPEKFGNTSWMAADPANKCVRENWFQPSKALTCDRCCTSSSWIYAKPGNTVSCTCTDEDHYRTPLRNHADCTLYTNRWPETPLLGFNGHLVGSRIDMGNKTYMGNGPEGSFNIHYTRKDFDSCVDPKNTPTWMAWQNCIEVGFPHCGNPDSPLAKPMVHNRLATLILKATGSALGREVARGLLSVELHGLLSEIEKCNNNFTFVGYYDTLAEGGRMAQDDPSYGKWLEKARHYVHSSHTLTHAVFGLDFADVCSSPNEPGAFAGSHAEFDRSNFHWMYNQRHLEGEDYYYPRRQRSTPDNAASPPWGLSGPWGLTALAECTTSFVNDDYSEVFKEYSFFDPLQPWVNGSLAEDVVNAGFPFRNLFGCKEDAPTGESCTGGDRGYTHHEILYWSAPSRTPYTYDTLEHLYY